MRLRKKRLHLLKLQGLTKTAKISIFVWSKTIKQINPPAWTS